MGESTILAIMLVYGSPPNNQHDVWDNGLWYHTTALEYSEDATLLLKGRYANYMFSNAIIRPYIVRSSLTHYQQLTEPAMTQSPDSSQMKLHKHMRIALAGGATFEIPGATGGAAWLVSESFRKGRLYKAFAAFSKEVWTTRGH